MASERAAEVSVRHRDLWKWRKDLQQRLLDLFGHAAPLTDHSLPSVDAFLSADPWQALPDIYVEADLELYRASGGDPAAQEEYLDVRGAALTPKDLALETGFPAPGRLVSSGWPSGGRRAIAAASLAEVAASATREPEPGASPTSWLQSHRVEWLSC
jgi:hypothetical protein